MHCPCASSIGQGKKTFTHKTWQNFISKPEQKTLNTKKGKELA
jgi:hypothetical protein